MRFEAAASQPSSQTAQPVQRDSDKERRKEGKRKREKDSRCRTTFYQLVTTAEQPILIIAPCVQRKRTEDGGNMT